MTTSALVFMLLVRSVILTMVAYCFFKLLTSKIQLGGDRMDEPPSDAT